MKTMEKADLENEIYQKPAESRPKRVQTPRVSLATGFSARFAKGLPAKRHGKTPRHGKPMARRTGVRT